MNQLLYEEESYNILGACFNVYKTMGCGFLENVYQECLEIEFKEQNILFSSQKELVIMFREHQLKQHYKPDFICYNKIIVEIKAVSEFSNEHRAQLINYLKATRMKLGFLVNFGHFPKIEYERLILTT